MMLTPFPVSMPVDPGAGPRSEDMNPLSLGLPTRDDLRTALHIVLMDPAHHVDHEVAVVMLSLGHVTDADVGVGPEGRVEMLHAVAGRLAAMVGPTWFVAHAERDTFAILHLPSASPEREGPDLAARLAAEVRTRIGGSVLVHGTQVHHLSMGVARAHAGDGRTAEGILHDALVAMYRAKREQRDYAEFASELDYDPEHRLARIADLRIAVDQRQLEVRYRPIVDLNGGATSSVEGVVLWNHPSRGVIAAEEFFGLAESCGLMGRLMMLVVEQVLSDAEDWRAAGHPMMCSVPISLGCLTRPGLVEKLVDTFTSSPDVLAVTVAASVMTDNRAVAALNALRSRGVRCAVEGVGMGFSALDGLKDLPGSTLKFESSRIDARTPDPRDVQLVANLVQIARLLELTLLAGGVEDERTARLLRDAGVTYGQGDHFAGHMGSAELPGWLASTDRTPTSTRRSAPGEHAVVLYEAETA